MGSELLVISPDDKAVADWLMRMENYKASDPASCAAVRGVIAVLEKTLELAPAVKTEELKARVLALDLITDQAGRDAISALRAEVVTAVDQVKICCTAVVAYAYERHKAKKAWEKSFLLPFEDMLDRVDAIIETDIEAQRAALAAEQQAQRKAADDARRAADLVAQQARAAALAETAKRQAAELAAQQARSKVARDKAAADLAQARAAEQAAKEAKAKAQADAEAAAVIPEFVPSAPVAVTGGVAVVKGKWKGRVFNIALVPEEYLLPRAVNQKMIDAKIEQWQGATTIPGVEPYQEAASVRSKAKR